MRSLINLIILILLAIIFLFLLSSCNSNLHYTKTAYNKKYRANYKVQNVCPTYYSNNPISKFNRKKY